MTEALVLDYQKMNHDLDITKSNVFRRPDAAFFGPVMCNLDFSWNESIPTAATDGKSLWWGPEDFLRCIAEGNGEDVSTLMHELWHVARLHALRQNGRENKKWNYACDIWINRELKKAGYYIGKDWVLHPEYDHIEAEEDIYDALPPMPNPPPCHCSHGNANMPTNIQGTISTVSKGIQAAKIAGQPGSVPGAMEQILNDFLAPVIPWEQHLYQWMADLGEFDFSWSRPNRRYTEMYLPTLIEDEGRLEHLLYFQDVSGSISENDIKRFNSELKYVWDTFQPKKMTIIQFDTIIQRVDELKEGEEFDKIKIKGRGGTCLIRVREEIIKRKPTAAIIFSDMHVTPMEKLPIEIPILWVATDGGFGIGHTPTFGKVIKIKTKGQTI